LSFGARGVMGYLLSKPDGWEIRNNDLYRQSPDGRAKVQGYLRELKARGYLLRKRISDGRGKIQWVSELYESLSMAGFSTFDNTSVEKYDVVKSVDILSTDSESNTEKQAKSKSNRDVDVKDLFKEVTPFPSTAFENAWDEWLEYRKKGKRKPVSIYGMKKQFKEFSKYTEQEAIEMIDNAIAKDWQGIFPLKNNKNGSSPNQRSKTAIANIAQELEK